MVKYTLDHCYIYWDTLGTIRLWSWIIMQIWMMHWYLACWDKLVLILRINWWIFLILVVKILWTMVEVKEHTLYLSRWKILPWHTCPRIIFSINCRNWVQFSMHYRNGFSTFQDVNSWIVGQGSRYSSIGNSSDCIGY